MSDLTNRDSIAVRNLLARAFFHSSGGSYDMVAMFVKGKRRVIGYNRLNDPASVHCDGYKAINGRHAELNVKELCERAGIDMRGGTLYIVGVRGVNQMLNTAPCEMCRGWLNDTKIKRFVYFNEGQLIKEVA